MKKLKHIKLFEAYIEAPKYEPVDPKVFTDIPGLEEKPEEKPVSKAEKPFNINEIKELLNNATWCTTSYPYFRDGVNLEGRFKIVPRSNYETPVYYDYIDTIKTILGNLGLDPKSKNGGDIFYNSFVFIKLGKDVELMHLMKDKDGTIYFMRSNEGSRKPYMEIPKDEVEEVSGLISDIARYGETFGLKRLSQK
jgi:hypothetical protein